MSDIIKKIENYKNELKQAELKKANLEGQYDNIIKQLKDEFGITTIEEAKELIVKLESKIKTLEESIEKKLTKLDEFDWN